MSDKLCINCQYVQKIDYIHPKIIRCNNDKAYCKGFLLLDNMKACGYWKPIKQCEKCGGTGEVCKYCNMPRKHCSPTYHHNFLFTPKSCPACSDGEEKVVANHQEKPKKRKRLIVPVRWENIAGGGEQLTAFKAGNTLLSIKKISSKGEDYHIIGRLADIYSSYNHRTMFEDIDQAKSAVEKALGVEGEINE